jgi:SAM-dependent methyltransferase
MQLKYLYRRVLYILRKLRAMVVTTIKPNAAYYMFGRTYKSTKPLSNIYGYDRGKPVDRYYMEKFMEENKEDIKGVCLEVTDNDYIVKYGGKRVTHSDAVDIDTSNPHANIYGDLRDIKIIKDNTYDCFVVTQTFVMIDDFEAAIKESFRILKPGGVLLCTMPCLGRVGIDLNQYWRFTQASGKYAFGKVFGEANVESKTYGNVLSGQCFWVGMASNELSSDQLDDHDPQYPVIVAVRAVKQK